MKKLLAKLLSRLNDEQINYFMKEAYNDLTVEEMKDLNKILNKILKIQNANNNNNS